MAFPVLAAALLALGADRKFGAHVFDPTNGGALLWQHLFWFFGHPEVYIIALPFFGIISEILPVFSRKPMFGYKGLVVRDHRASRALSVTVWAHHMYVTGAGAAAVLRVHDDADRGAHRGEVLQLDRHDVGRLLSFETPMLWAIGFLVTFLFGGLTGVILASPPLDFHLSDSYFVVAHFHYVVFGTVVFAMFAGLLLLVAEVHRQDARRAAGQDPLLDAVHRLPHHLPRSSTGWASRACPAGTRTTCPRTASPTLNQISTVGALPARRRPRCRSSTTSGRPGARAAGRDRRPVGLRPFAGVGDLLPAAAAQLRPLPRIRSERPAFDLHHPEVGAHGPTHPGQGRHGPPAG